MEMTITTAGLLSTLDIDGADESLVGAVEQHAAGLNTLVEGYEAAVRTIDQNEELTGKGKTARLEQVVAECEKQFDRIDAAFDKTRDAVERERAWLHDSIDKCLDDPPLKSDATDAQRQARLEAKVAGAARATWIVGQLAGLDPIMLEAKLHEAVELNDRETLRAILSVPSTFRLVSPAQAASLRRAYASRHHPDIDKRLATLDAFRVTTTYNQNTVAQRLGFVPSVADLMADA